MTRRGRQRSADLDRVRHHDSHGSSADGRHGFAGGNLKVVHGINRDRAIGRAIDGESHTGDRHAATRQFRHDYQPCLGVEHASSGQGDGRPGERTGAASIVARSLGQFRRMGCRRQSSLRVKNFIRRYGAGKPQKSSRQDCTTDDNGTIDRSIDRHEKLLLVRKPFGVSNESRPAMKRGCDALISRRRRTKSKNGYCRRRIESAGGKCSCHIKCAGKT